MAHQNQDKEEEEEEERESVKNGGFGQEESEKSK